MNFSKADIERFWSKVNVKGPDDCWEWLTCCTIPQGYGRFRTTVTHLRAHRVAYFLSFNVDPSNLCVCHSCDNPGCCNPNHLWLGTHQDNVDDRERKGRGNHNRRGEEVPTSKLTKDNVMQIRKLYATGNYSQSQLGRKFGVSQGQVLNIVNRKQWRHI